jgi:pimeloyl-ACP methyl ester carboxylesterase
MPAVLVHGVPDTHRVWDRVRAQLTRKDVVALALPGFDNPAPAGFTSTKEAYADWITQQLETIGTPVDLVGHDWGCMLTARIASIRPDLVRTWTGISVDVSCYCPKCHRLMSSNQREEMPAFIALHSHRWCRSIQMRPCPETVAFWPLCHLMVS